MAFDIAAAEAAADNVALTVRDIETAAAALEVTRAALVVRVQAWADADWEAGPLAAARVQIAEITALRNKVKAFVKGLTDQSLLAVETSFSDWYAANRTLADRLPPEFGQLVRANAGQIDPRYIWPPYETAMGDAVFPGAAADTSVVATPYDTKQYAGADLMTRVKFATIVTSAVGDLTVAVNGLQYNGDPFHGVAVISSGDIIGTESPVQVSDGMGGFLTDVFCVEVTSIVVTPTGVETWDAGEFDVLVDDDRVPAA